MKKLTTLLIIYICLLSFSINAQESKEKPKDYSSNVLTLNGIINTFYDVISGEKGETRDWTLFKHLFKTNAKLIPSIKNEKGVYTVGYMSPDDYIKTSGKWLVDTGFFEKEINREVHTFSNISQVFSTYEAYKTSAYENPIMRGINSFQLLNDGKRWWIINVYWTQETDDKLIPNDYLPKQ